MNASKVTSCLYFIFNICIDNCNTTGNLAIFGPALSAAIHPRIRLL